LRACDSASGSGCQNASRLLRFYPRGTTIDDDDFGEGEDGDEGGRADMGGEAGENDDGEGDGDGMDEDYLWRDGEEPTVRPDGQDWGVQEEREEEYPQDEDILRVELELFPESDFIGSEGYDDSSHPPATSHPNPVDDDEPDSDDEEYSHHDGNPYNLRRKPRRIWTRAEVGS
jgi:hypothetical protein